MITENLSENDLVEACNTCSEDCPWTGLSRGVDVGCLPSPFEMVNHALEENEIFSCHENYEKPCGPLAKFLSKNGVDVKKLKLIDNR